MRTESKIQMILDWAEDNDWFDTSFIESVSDFFDDKGFITEAQNDALDNIIERFNI